LLYIEQRVSQKTDSDTCKCR